MDHWSRFDTRGWTRVTVCVREGRAGVKSPAAGNCNGLRGDDKAWGVLEAAKSSRAAIALPDFFSNSARW
jgi:hypothetical protein